MTQTNTPILIANYHTHTTRCGHARGCERDYIEQAIRAGMRILGFADHAPYPFPDGYNSGFRMRVEQTADYTETLCALREEYKQDIEIYIGYETEYYPDFFSDAMQNLCAYPVDYLILGQHFLENEITKVYSGAPTDDEGRLSAYVDQVSEGLSTGVFSCVAHPDLLHFTGDNAIYETQMRRLCENAKRLDIPLEINFLGLKEHRHYPCDRFWQIAADVGNSVIFGCDAHSPDMLSDFGLFQSAAAYAHRFGLHPQKTLTLRDPHSFFTKSCPNQ